MPQRLFVGYLFVHPLTTTHRFTGSRRNSPEFIKDLCILSQEKRAGGFDSGSAGEKKIQERER